MSPRRLRAPGRAFRAVGLLLAAALLGSCGGSGGGGGPVLLAPPGSGANGAELSVDSVTFSPQVLTAGDAITTNDVVRNAGNQVAAGFQVGIYLSDDPVVTTADVLLGFRTVGSLAPGATSSGGGSLTVPLVTLGGTYWVGALADDLGAVAETDETNNARVAATTVSVATAPLPDLVGASISFQPLVVDAGDALDVTETVENAGSLDAAGVVVGIYLSSDATITPVDVLIGFRSLASLSVGQTSTATSTVTVPLGTFAGLYHVGVIADDIDAHVEHDEVNNVVSAPVRLQVNAPPRPDLVPSGISFGPSVVDAGSAIQVSDAVLNQGVVDAGAFRIGIYLSSDAAVSSADTRIGERFLPGLPVGLSSAVSSLPVTIPPDTTAGTWYVGVLVDDLGVVAETDEGNNGLAAFGTLQVNTPPAADLAVTSVAFAPGSVQPVLGEKVTVTDTVRNQGIVAAGPFRVGYYLSSNPVVTAGDIFLGSRSLSGLAVGDSSQGSAAVTLPSGLGAGSYFIGAIADDEALVFEVATANNARTASSPLDVVAAPMPMPDLFVESVGFTPKVTVAGGVIQVQDLTRNHGTQSATTFRIGIFLSADADVSTDDVKIGERTVSGLAIGFGSATSAPYTIPAGTPPGLYRVGAVCDVLDEVAEGDESDNALAALGYLTVN